MKRFRTSMVYMMHVRKTAFMAAGLTLMTALGGCLSTVSLREGAPGYDGIWIGRANFSIGEDRCPRRAAVRVDVVKGIVDGKLRTEFGTGSMKGYIGEDGVLEDPQLDLNIYGGADAKVSGKFDGEEAHGEWSTPQCRGTWDLERVKS